MTLVRSALVWAIVLLAVAVPLAAAAASPLLAWREPIYIIAGFAGIAAMSFLLLQPLLANRMLPGLSAHLSRRLHRLSGFGLLIAVLAHVIGLWITSPPDVVDALLFNSPTPFAVWGVSAMWAALAVGLLAVLRKKMRGHLKLWRFLHVGLAVVVVIGSVLHAVLIEGTMETVSKLALCALVIAATAKLLNDLRRRAMRRH